jgi:hypothetical protein
VLLAIGLRFLLVPLKVHTPSIVLLPASFQG